MVTYMKTEKYWDGENWLRMVDSSNVIEYYLGDELHRNDGPAKKHYSMFGNVFLEIYYQNGLNHRENAPAQFEYDENGEIERKCYYHNGEKHRKDGPADIWYYDINETVLKQFFYYNGIEFDPNLLPFEMPIDNPEKEFYMKLKYGE